MHDVTVYGEEESREQDILIKENKETLLKNLENIRLITNANVLNLDIESSYSSLSKV